MALSTYIIPNTKSNQLSLGGTSQDKFDRGDRGDSTNNRIGRLHQEADSLKQRLNQVEEQKNALANNR